jgi:hypothetical protein
MTTYDLVTAYAAWLGREHGRYAAGRYAEDAINGDASSASVVLSGLENRSPAIMEALPSPDLSGRGLYALTGQQLFEEALDTSDVASDDPLADDAELYDAVLRAYEAAFNDAVEGTIGRLARGKDE